MRSLTFKERKKIEWYLFGSRMKKWGGSFICIFGWFDGSLILFLGPEDLSMVNWRKGARKERGWSSRWEAEWFMDQESGTRWKEWDVIDFDLLEEHRWRSTIRVQFRDKKKEYGKDSHLLDPFSLDSKTSRVKSLQKKIGG